MRGSNTGRVWLGAAVLRAGYKPSFPIPRDLQIENLKREVETLRMELEKIKLEVRPHAGVAWGQWGEGGGRCCQSGSAPLSGRGQV